MKFYKITNEQEKHRDMQYKDGLNVDVLPYKPEGDCQGGGLYFSREDILAFLDYGVWIREVTIPKGDPKPYKNPGKPVKWKAHRIILGKRKKITARLVGELIDEGARDDVFNDDGFIPLVNAMLADKMSFFNVLVDKTKNLNIKMPDRDSAPLHFAVDYGDLCYVKKLIEKDVEVDTKDGNGETPLFLVCRASNYKIAKFLLKAGADVNVISKPGLSCLHHAIFDADEKMVRLLMKYGANPNLGDNETYSPLQMAQENGLDDIVKLLKRKKR